MSFSVGQVVEQPTFRMLRAQEDDVVDYVTAMNSDESIRVKDKRFALVDVEGGLRVKAIQGHSQQTAAVAAEAAGLEPNVGRAYRVEDEYFSQYLLHGMKAGDAAYIYRDGLLV